MKIQYNGSSKILKRLVELVNRSQNVALRQDNTDKNTLYWTGLDGVEITVNIPSGAVEVDAELSETSTNPVENQAIAKEIAKKADKSDIPAVGNGTLSVQRNGKSVGTFSANAAENEAINIPVPEKVSELENDAGYGTYTKPTTGIPKSDLASSVQASLGKADTALQKHQDISGKQDKSTAVTHTANTAVGSATKPVYIAANGAATPISHSINADVPANAKFTDTTYSDATQSTHGLMTATDKKKLDGMDSTKYLPKSGGVMTGDIDMATNGVDLLVGTQLASQGTYASAVAGAAVAGKEPLETGLPKRKSLIGSWLDENSVWHNILSVRHRNGWNDGPNYGFYLRSLLTSNGSLFWNKQTGAGKWQGERVLLDSTNYSSYAAKSDHTHAMITNSAMWIAGANNTANWVKLGTLVSSGNFSNGVIRVWTGDGANGRANQNSSFEIQIKDGWQSTLSADKACGVTVYRISCSDVKVKVIPTAHDTYTVWAYMPWWYWNGNYAVYGKYKSWTSQHLIQSGEPEGTGANTAYYDQAFLTSTVAAAKTLTDSGWVAMTVEGYAKSGTVKYRTYGKQITITGSAVLKNDIATSYPAPQYIASTTFDFSKIVGCSGVGRSSSGVGVYVAVENYNGDNLVSVYALGSKIAAGSTLYFTITGFID